MQSLNPEDFIISRKRKKYKFALFANSPLCFELDEWQNDWSPAIIEIGAGTGEFLRKLAEQDSRRNFLAVDVKADRLQKGARQAQELGLTNIKFLRARADQLVEIFKPNSLEQIWLTFSDPFLKTRSAGRRLTHPHFLNHYQTLLDKNGSLLIKHDNQDFFNWSLEQLVQNNWTIKQLSFDLHASDLPAKYKTLTAYEQRWLQQNSQIKFAAVRPPV